MASRRTLRIAHLSDLHLGTEKDSPWRVRRVLGKAWQDNLQALAQDGPIDLLCFTGDLAQSGLPAQYEQARAFIDELLALLRVPKERFFCVPGNHDVNRRVARKPWAHVRDKAGRVERAAFDRWMGGGPVPLGFEDAWRAAVLKRQDAYRKFLASMDLPHLLPPRGRLGFRATLHLGLEAPLHVVGLDSAWLAGDEHDAGNLRLTNEQVGRLLTDQGAPLPGWKLALVHHPLTDLADGREAQRLLREFGVSLLLHGHLHDAEVARWSTPAASLHVAAAGCLYESDGYPNSLQVLDVALPPAQPIQPRKLWARSWSALGHWHNDEGLYPGSIGGRLALMEEEPPAAFTPGRFIGREGELQQLCEALLPRPGEPLRPTVLCCVVEGMAGVGKTRLAEEFVNRHWLPALGVSADAANPAAYHQRLILDPLEPAPTALALGSKLADRLRCSGPDDTLWQRLGAALRYGPQGHPWLLLIENVDAEPQACAVGDLVNRLPGCPVLVTARYQRLGGDGWTRVKVAQMPPLDARALLRAELDADAYPLTDAEADDLAEKLGRLPLALHIAASHLKLGLTPKAFLDELRATGLKLEPEPGDPRLVADRARAILRSSFELSWRHWCAHAGADEAWQQALVALAHGPAAPTGPSLSAAIAGLKESRYLAFATAAARLSLLQYSAQTGRTALHPLIAEFLRGRPKPDAQTVVKRLGGWFMRRLPATGDEAQGKAWDECWAEAQALTYWLSVVPLEDGLAAERAGALFAYRNGPYAAWQGLCERLIGLTREVGHLSNLWWTLSRTARRGGDLERALQAARIQRDMDLTRGAQRDAAAAAGTIADVYQAQGKLGEALRMRREAQLPVYERLSDWRERAVTLGRVADVLQTLGEWPQALRIRREEQLPVFEKLGDKRERAVTLGRIADVLQKQGKLDEALRIRREEQLPVYEMLGDKRERAMALGRVADVLQKQGTLDEALRIRREEQLPVYESLRDERLRAVTLGQIADVLQARGDWDEALRIRREEQLPVCERLGNTRSLLIARTNLARCLYQRNHPEDHAEIKHLLAQAFSAASRMKLPEAQQVQQWHEHIFGTPLEPEAEA